MNLLDQARRMAPSLSRGVPFTYILRLQSGGLYIGCSTDFESRFRDHALGTACRTTHLDTPTKVEWIEVHPDYPSARHREAQIKKWSRAKKEALIAKDKEALRRLAKQKAPSKADGSRVSRIADG